MDNEKKFIGLKQVVVVVLLTLLNIVISMISGLPFSFSPKLMVLVGYSLAALLNGIVYVLMIAKSPIRGTNLLFFGVKVIYVILFGQIPTGIVYLVGGIICEAITWNDGYKKPLKAGSSFAIHNVVFSIGSFTPIFLNPEAYAQHMRENMASMDPDMVETMVHAMIYELVEPSFLLLAIVLIIVGSAIGFFAGMKMMKKHFRPAGVA